MWDISTSSIAGSHLDYLQKALVDRKSGGQKSNGNGHKTTNDPDKFVKGKYGHMVQR
jgi:hypothetical protein